jgi:hypothetical protein
VTGTLRGERVSARFTRVDGCAIAAYDALLRALGRPPAVDDTRVADPSTSLRLRSSACDRRPEAASD